MHECPIDDTGVTELLPFLLASSFAVFHRVSSLQMTNQIYMLVEYEIGNGGFQSEQIFVLPK